MRDLVHSISGPVGKGAILEGFLRSGALKLGNSTPSPKVRVIRPNDSFTNPTDTPSYTSRHLAVTLRPRTTCGPLGQHDPSKALRPHTGALLSTLFTLHLLQAQCTGSFIMTTRTCANCTEELLKERITWGHSHSPTRFTVLQLTVFHSSERGKPPQHLKFADLFAIFHSPFFPEHSGVPLLKWINPQRELTSGSARGTT